MITFWAACLRSGSHNLKAVELISKIGTRQWCVYHIVVGIVVDHFKIQYFLILSSEPIVVVFVSAPKLSIGKIFTDYRCFIWYHNIFDFVSPISTSTVPFVRGGSKTQYIVPSKILCCYTVFYLFAIFINYDRLLIVHITAFHHDTIYHKCNTLSCVKRTRKNVRIGSSARWIGEAASGRSHGSLCKIYVARLAKFFITKPRWYKFNAVFVRIINNFLVN